jgi:hypothetical protein
VTIGITTGRKAGLSVNRIGGGDGAGQAPTAAALADVAGRVATSLASELRLAHDGDGRQATSSGGGDPYAIDDLARELASRLGGSTADAGHIARALHEFAQESASLIGARPDSRSFAQIEAAIAPEQAQAGGPDTVQSALVMIEQSTARIKGS